MLLYSFFVRLFVRFFIRKPPNLCSSPALQGIMHVEFMKIRMGQRRLLMALVV